jgi:hypothetical protein
MRKSCSALRLNIPALVAFLILGAVPSVAVAETPLPPHWQVLSMPGKAVTRFAAAGDGAIAVDARNSVGFLYRKTGGLPGAGRYLTWRWRVDAAPPPTDLSMKGMDDRPLAVHVWFDEGADTTGDWAFTTRLGAWLFDRPLPGKMLTYVWGGLGARGQVLPNPYREKAGHIIVLRPGTSRVGAWHTETVDIVSDYRAAFGTRPGAPAYVAISADTDDKGGAAKGFVAGLAFTDKP